MGQTPNWGINNGEYNTQIARATPANRLWVFTCGDKSTPWKFVREDATMNVLAEPAGCEPSAGEAAYSMERLFGAITPPLLFVSRLPSHSNYRSNNLSHKRESSAQRCYQSKNIHRDQPLNSEPHPPSANPASQLTVTRQHVIASGKQLFIKQLFLQFRNDTGGLTPCAKSGVHSDFRAFLAGLTFMHDFSLVAKSATWLNAEACAKTAQKSVHKRHFCQKTDENATYALKALFCQANWPVSGCFYLTNSCLNDALVLTAHERQPKRSQMGGLRLSFVRCNNKNVAAPGESLRSHALPSLFLNKEVGAVAATPISTNNAGTPSRKISGKTSPHAASLIYTQPEKGIHHGLVA